MQLAVADGGHIQRAFFKVPNKNWDVYYGNTGGPVLCVCVYKDLAGCNQDFWVYSDSFVTAGGQKWSSQK